MIKYFHHLSKDIQDEIFFKKPEPLNKKEDRNLLSYSFGATLYVPATKDNINQLISTDRFPWQKTMIFCLEDAIGDSVVEIALKNLISSLNTVKDYDDDKWLFVRVRNNEQIEEIISSLENKNIIDGFVLPKVNSLTLNTYLETIKTLNNKYGLRLYALPILESEEIISKYTRYAELENLKKVTDAHRDIVLNIRLGGTDFSGLYGIRRSKEHTIYDIIVVRDCISDILGTFGLYDEYTVSSVVWEHYNTDINDISMQNLLKEVSLDLENGFIGKTAINPIQIPLIQLSHIVPYELYIDAQNIYDKKESGGVIRSDFSNKMNEVKPHSLWASKILKRAKIFGVYNEKYNVKSTIEKIL